MAPTPAAIFVNEAAGSARTRRARRTVELAQRMLNADVHAVATRDQAEPVKAKLEKEELFKPWITR